MCLFWCDCEERAKKLKESPYYHRFDDMSLKKVILELESRIIALEKRLEPEVNQVEGTD